MRRSMLLLLLLACLSCANNNDGAHAGAVEVGNAGAGAPSPTQSPEVPPADSTARASLGTAPARAPRTLDSIPALPSYTYLTGKFDPAKHPDFVKVAARYTDGDPYVLHRETYAAFERMHAAAKADGVNLTIVSATRNFDRQKSIWEAKWKGQRLLEGKDKADVVYPDPADRATAILRFSSMPGTSRHHWGTDIDINRLTNDYFQSGKGKAEYDWLVANGPTYGFCQPYTPLGEARPTGYQEERWHWSYVPLARKLTDYAATEMKIEDINGFAGAEVARKLDVINNYVLGINRDCR